MGINFFSSSTASKSGREYRVLCSNVCHKVLLEPRPIAGPGAAAAGGALMFGSFSSSRRPKTTNRSACRYRGKVM